MIEKPIWHSGPPPHIGWWNASFCRNYVTTWRWWDGECWSTAVDMGVTASSAAKKARRKSDYPNIKWTDYYPKNARVRRAAP